MVRTCVAALLVAAVWAALPTPAPGQRIVSYTSSTERDTSNELPQLNPESTPPGEGGWRPSEIALAGAFTAALLIDAGATRRLAAGGWRDYTESNPILGPRPSVGQVNTYTVVAGVTVLGVAAVAPRRARPWILGAALAVEVVALAAMSREGVAIRIF
jgi:hypothetical protein